MSIKLEIFGNIKVNLTKVNMFDIVMKRGI